MTSRPRAPSTLESPAFSWSTLAQSRSKPSIGYEEARIDVIPPESAVYSHSGTHFQRHNSASDPCSGASDSEAPNTGHLPSYNFGPTSCVPLGHTIQGMTSSPLYAESLHELSKCGYPVESRNLYGPQPEFHDLVSLSFAHGNAGISTNYSLVCRK